MPKKIVSDPAILGGDYVFEGTRISFAHIVKLVQNGVLDMDLKMDYGLDDADIRATRNFAQYFIPFDRGRK